MTLKKIGPWIGKWMVLIPLLGLFSVLDTQAQYSILTEEDLKSVRVDDLSDQQIQMIQEELDEQGLSEKEWEALAVLNGMPQSEVSKLKVRIAEVSSKMPSEGDLFLNDKRLPNEDESKREVDFELEEEHLEIFGASFFNDEGLSFEPGFNVATPANYQLGPGDQVMIDVWGGSQRSYQLQVSNEGSLLVEGVGPIFVSGLDLEAAEEKIKTRLSKIFSGIRSTPANTFVQVGLAGMRSIKVSIIGEVRAPGTYTVSAVSTVFNALYLSGGPSYLGSLRNIRLMRAGREVASLDLYAFLTKGDLTANVRLRDQDVIVIGPYESRVRMDGAVKRPAVYELKSGENLEEALLYAGGFSDQAYGKQLRVERNTTKGKRIESVSETAFSTFKMQNGDLVTVDAISGRFENRVTVRGAVFREGEYQLKEGMTVTQLIELAEGVRPDAFLNRANVYRISEDYSTEVLAFDLSKLLNGTTTDISLKREDVVQITSVYDLQENYALHIEGEVQTPGTYPFMRQMTLSDLLILAGGFTESASEVGIEVARRVRDNGKTSDKIAEVFKFELSKDLQIKGDGQSFTLEPFDRVYVRKSPGYAQQRSVWLSGEVVYPGRYVLEKKNERISDMVSRAGGVTPYAYLAGARLRRRYNSQYKDIGIDLKRIIDKPGSEEDLFLAAGDSLFLPLEVQVVQLEGELFNPVAVQYVRSKSFGDYVSGGGGYSNDALRRRAYVRYANGSLKQTRNFLFFRIRPKVAPGSSIIVPTKSERRKMSAQEAVGWTSAVATLGLIIVNIVNAVDSNP